MNNQIFFILFILSSVLLMGEWITVDQEYDNEMISYTQTRLSEIELEYQIDGFNVDNIRYEGIEYTRISLPEASDLCLPGKPELPVFTTIIAIPFQGEAKLEIVSFRSYFIYDILVYPQEEIEQDSENGDRFTIDIEYYRSGGVFPEELVMAGEPAVMRDMRVLSLTFCPFRYNAQERSLEVITEISVKIVAEGNGGINCKTRKGAVSRSFEPLYQATVLNYETVRSRDDYQVPALLFIVPDDGDIMDLLHYLTDWKQQKGFEVRVASTAATGETVSEIKDYIQDAYDNWDNPPEHVCLVGDAAGDYIIPTWFNNGSFGEGDQPYGLLEGDDFLLDVNLGRLSFNNLSTLAVLITKIINYEKAPYTENPQWMQKALLIGDPHHSGYSTISTMLGIKEMMLTYPDNWYGDDNFYEVYSSPFPSQMNSAINAGVLYMFYRGYLGTSGWSTTNISNLNNGWMLPFASIITCSTGNYANGDGISEVFTRLGTVTTPKGAIGMIGEATSGNHTCFNNAITLGIASGIFQHGIYSMGGALTMGKYYMWSLYPQNPGAYINAYSHYNNLMGDPSLELWTGIPQELNVICDDQIMTGENWFQVTVLDSLNINAENAWVTLSASSPEEFAVTGFTNEYGQLLLPVADLPEGYYLLTVSRHNHIPSVDSIAVIQAAQYVDIEEIEYLEIIGNGDGILNPGETVELAVILGNYGTSPVNGVTAALGCNNNLITIITDGAAYGDIIAGGTSAPADNFRIAINPAALDGLEPVFEFTINDDNTHEWTTWHTGMISGANLWISDYTIGGNGILEPGDADDIYFTLTNNGAMAVEDVEGILSCQTAGITLIDGQGYFGDILPGETGQNEENRFTVCVSDVVIPGTQITFRIHLTSPTGYDNIVTCLVPAGFVSLTDPYGPDEQGYMCFDDGDIGYDQCPEFDWIEINPDLGGEGECLTVTAGSGTGAVQVIDFPEDFHFKFYGDSYEQLTICTNGWIAPGIHEAASFMNWFIPSPQGPSPIIAVFWDDLKTNISSAEVCYYYDGLGNYLVVEWSQVKNGDTDADETFEVILYDSYYFPTITEDSEIKMQYLEVTNNNAGTYPTNHGQYCTIGLENEDSSIGLQYTFNNTYATANKVLEDETALLFTSSYLSDELPFLSIGEVLISAGDDEFIEAGENVSLLFEVVNTGYTAANNISIVVSASDLYIEITESTSSIDNIAFNGIATIETPLAFSVVEYVPDYHYFEIVVNMESDEFTWERVIGFTAYQPNTFSVDQDSIYIEMNINCLDRLDFELTNIGNLPVEFYVRTDEISTPQRNIGDSNVTCDTDEFTPGETRDWIFYVYNETDDSEWISNVLLTFPHGVTVNHASNGVGGSGGDLVWDGTTGTGQLITWSGLTPNGFGVLQNWETAEITVNVTLSTEFAGDFEINWLLVGDGYGAGPHEMAGECTFLFPLRWINLDTSYGILEPADCRAITVTFNTFDLEAGIYQALIEISCDLWDKRRIQAVLNVTGNIAEEEDIPAQTMLLGNYPNPFNPSTEICFQLAKAERTELRIFNLKGQAVRNYPTQILETGKHSITWDGADEMGRSSGSGIYLYQLKTGEVVLTGKMLLIK
ncbi:MAG: T9SS type A sorting domain-containing protein [Candidatus Cloacimonetes bacterium]|nr:T9SS type A sorting domain-containing protein [Candidatus Cloacimonadota bacterium]